MTMVDVKQYGAAGDGFADDTATIQSALAAASAAGQTCYLPPGQYRLDGSLVVPPGVTLQGASGGVPHSKHPIGATLLAYGGRGDAAGDPLIQLKYNATVRNLIIHYPEQVMPDIVPYPWTIQGEGRLCQVTDLVMTNPFQAIDFGAYPNELHTIRNVFACPLNIGVYIDQCTDIGRLENVHFNPNFWTQMTLDPPFPTHDRSNFQKLFDYQAANLIGFKVGKTDWEYISNSFVIFPAAGFLFDDFGHGSGNAVITQSGSDICPMAVRVNRTQKHAGVQFANGQFMATLEVAETNEGPVKLANCGFWGVPQTKAQIIKHGPSTLSLTSCHFTGWDAAHTGEPCIRADGGRLIVSGCDFMDEGKRQIELDEGLTAATIFGNLLRGDGGVVNRSTGDVQIGLNTTL